MKNKFLIICIGVILILSSTFNLFGCVDEKVSEDEKSEKVSESSKNISEEVSEDTIKDNKNVQYESLTKKDMNGRIFNVIERRFGLGKDTIDFSGEVLYMEDAEGKLDVFNQAKKDIIEQIQKDYNCHIKGEFFSDGGNDMVKNLKDLIIADAESKTGKYDFFFESPFYYFSLIEKGYLKNINQISTINTESSCWNENAVSDFSINGGLYFINGDINTYDNSGSIVMLFNKELYKKSGYTEDIFSLVKDKKWTFDKLTQLAMSFTSVDVNKNGAADEFDTWFMGSETSNIYAHIVSSDNGICTKNENDIPEISISTDSAINACIDAYEFIAESKKVLVANLPEFYEKYPNPGECYEKTVTKAFLEGRELFYATTLIHVPFYRQSDVDFGIIPFPMYTSAQGKYVSTESVHTTSALMIPNTPKADEDSGLIIQALCELSEERLTPLYYDKLLNHKNGRDNQSEEMLDIIFESKKYDLGTIMGFEWPYSSLFHKNDPLWCGPTLSDICQRDKAILEDTVEKIIKMQTELKN